MFSFPRNVYELLCLVQQLNNMEEKSIIKEKDPAKYGKDGSIEKGMEEAFGRGIRPWGWASKKHYEGVK